MAIAEDAPLALQDAEAVVQAEREKVGQILPREMWYFTIPTELPPELESNAADSMAARGVQYLQVLQTYLYAFAGRADAEKQGRRLYYTPMIKTVEIVDTPGRLAGAQLIVETMNDLIKDKTYITRTRGSEEFVDVPDFELALIWHASDEATITEVEKLAAENPDTIIRFVPIARAVIISGQPMDAMKLKSKIHNFDREQKSNSPYMTEKEFTVSPGDKEEIVAKIWEALYGNHYYIARSNSEAVDNRIKIKTTAGNIALVEEIIDDFSKSE